MEGGESTLSEAERRRVRRRQRILENQGARLDRILGGNSSSKSSNDILQGSDNFGGEGDHPSPPPPRRTSTSSNTAAETSRNVKATISSLSSSPITIHTRATEKKKNESGLPPSSLPQLLKELSEDFVGLQSPTITSSLEGPRMGVQADGTVIMPKIPHYVGRILICVLALFLSLMNAKQYAITFISLEIAYYFLNGLPPYPPPNTVLVALALVGLKESRLKIVKKILHIIDCTTVDFSLFLTFSMMPHMISGMIQMF